MAEHAIGRTGDRYPHAAIGLRDKDADQGEARGWLVELLVASLLGDRKADRGDDLAGFQRGAEHAEKEIICGDLALRRVDRRAEGQQGAWVAGGRVIVGDRAADRAHCPHLLVADMGGQVGQRRDRCLDFGAVGHIEVAGHRSDHQGIAVAADAAQFLDRAEVGKLSWIRQAQLHRGEQRLAAGQQRGTATGQACGVSQRGRAFKCE